MPKAAVIQWKEINMGCYWGICAGVDPQQHDPTVLQIDCRVFERRCFGADLQGVCVKRLLLGMAVSREVLGPWGI